MLEEIVVTSFQVDSPCFEIFQRGGHKVFRRIPAGNGKTQDIINNRSVDNRFVLF